MNNILLSSSSSSDDEDHVFIRRPKKYYIRKNYVEIYDDLDFFHRFRITKSTFNILLGKIEHIIRTPTNLGGSIKPQIQLLLTLRFYACGSIQRLIADFSGVSIFFSDIVFFWSSYLSAFIHSLSFHVFTELL
ncbi:hypothetical protein ABEB36_000505 [Hypothenemus hampei]|uniref:Nuclease HARBI1 n=1 Tax=Hypothenemus hampei TaxID=57062 RepID=A0ABD1FC21_HYPHA